MPQQVDFGDGFPQDWADGEQPLELSEAFVAALPQRLRAIKAEPKLEADEALYKICGLRWKSAANLVVLIRQWLPDMLAALAARPKDRAFACLEQLSQNPQTKDFPEVAAMYAQLMAEVVGGAATTTEGIDGFQLRTDADRTVDAMLRAGADGEARGAYAHVELAARQAASDPSAMLRAMNARVRWLKEHESSASETPGIYWKSDLGNLYFNILKQSPTLAASALAELCGIDALGWLAVAPTSALFEACEAYVDRNGFEPSLSRAMREWVKTVHGGATAQALRKAIDWLLWFDTEAPVDVKKCWSGLIHKDLRAMSPEKRGPWVALLRNVTFAIADEPTKKWLRPAPKMLAAIDPAEFRHRIRTWFEPFRAAQPLKITVAGRDILLALFWYAQLAKDAQVDEAVLWFATAKWKAKTDLDRTARLLPVWIHTLRERCPDKAIDAVHAYKATGQLDLTGKSLDLYNELCKAQGRSPEIEPPVLPVFDKEVFLRTQLAKVVLAVGTRDFADD